MTEFIPLVALAAFGWKGLDLIKYLTNREIKPAVTLASAWAVGCGLVWLAGETVLLKSTTIPGLAQTFGDLDLGGIVLVGVSFLASPAAIAIDFKRALDGSDSAATPSLIPPKK